MENGKWKIENYSLCSLRCQGKVHNALNRLARKDALWGADCLKIEDFKLGKCKTWPATEALEHHCRQSRPETPPTFKSPTSNE